MSNAQLPKQSKRRDPFLLSFVNFRNIVILTAGAGLGISSVFLAGAATTDSSVNNILSLINTQCKSDVVCISDVATGLERAANTLTQVAQALRDQLASSGTGIMNPLTPAPDELEPGPSSPLTPAPGTDLGCYYRLSDTNQSDTVFADGVYTYRIETGGTVEGLYTSSNTCEPVYLQCSDRRITLRDVTGAMLNHNLIMKYIAKSGMASPTNYIYFADDSGYLGESLTNCKSSAEYKRLVTVSDTYPPTTIVDGPSTKTGGIVTLPPVQDPTPYPMPGTADPLDKGPVSREDPLDKGPVSREDPLDKGPVSREDPLDDEPVYRKNSYKNPAIMEQ